MATKPAEPRKFESGDPLSAEELTEIFPDLKAIPAAKLKAVAEGAAVRRRFEAGDIVCTEGEFGSTAFYITGGSVDIFVTTPLAKVRTQSNKGRIFARMRSFLGSDSGAEPDASARRYIPVDASVDLDRANAIATMGAGDLFGEMSCRNFQPRSATVRAREDCVMIEMLRVVLDLLLGTREVKGATYKAKETGFKKRLDEQYRARSLMSHLRSVPIFASLSDEFLAHLQEKVRLESYFSEIKNEPITLCRQGEEGDAFFLIRTGMVKVTRSMPGGEMVLSYLAKGDFFGEIALVKESPRTATCTALDYVDLVVIPREDFEEMLRLFPQVRAELTRIADARLEAIRSREQVAAVGMDDFLDQGLAAAQNLLLIDLDKCTRCDLCVRACAEAHDGVTRLLRDGLRYEKYLVATACRSCRDPLCMTQCPVGSIRRKESLEVLIEDWCIGCGKCADLCPYGNITMHPLSLLGGGSAPAPAMARDKATTCDLCTDLATPSCVYACPHDAAMRVEPASFFAKRLGLGETAAIPVQWKKQRRLTHAPDDE